jgi:hypothetical protein
MKKLADPLLSQRHFASFTVAVKPAKYRWFDNGIFRPPSIKLECKALILKLRIHPKLHEAYA